MKVLKSFSEPLFVKFWSDELSEILADWFVFICQLHSKKLLRAVLDIFVIRMQCKNCWFGFIRLPYKNGLLSESESKSGVFNMPYFGEKQVKLSLLKFANER